MQETIIKQLDNIEVKENISILYAAESGSRAWGFESIDSDYDVRFIYVHEKNYYLQLDKQRDYIEVPLNKILDINGWDLDKSLRLLHNSNPTLFEWCNSPVVYKTTPYFESLKTIINDYFKAKSGLYHYLNMASGNYREYLRGEMVRAKKYFYVVRPILACKWILRHDSPPPMLFSVLYKEILSDDLKPVISDLLELKMKSPEIVEIKRINVLNEYIENNLSELKSIIDSLPSEEARDFGQLNKLFLEALELQLKIV